MGLRIAMLDWSAAPGASATLAIATGDARRERLLTGAFGVEGPCADGRPRAGLWRVPDAAVVDSPALLDHPAVRRLVALPRRAAAIMLGAGDDVEVSLAMLRAGVAALLPGDVSAGELRDTVAGVLRGEAAVPPAVASAVVRRLRAAEQA